MILRTSKIPDLNKYRDRGAGGGGLCLSYLLSVISVYFLMKIKAIAYESYVDYQANGDHFVVTNCWYNGMKKSCTFFSWHVVKTFIACLLLGFQLRTFCSDRLTS